MVLSAGLFVFIMKALQNKLKFLVDKLIKIVACEYFLVNFASETILI